MSFNYEETELRRLVGNTYRIKITSEAGGETRWLTVSERTFAKIADALIEQGQEGPGMAEHDRTE